MDRHQVTKTRELIDAGFYDDPEVLDALIDRCLEGVLRRVNQSPARKGRARIVSTPPAKRGDRTGTRSTARPRHAARDPVVASKRMARTLV